MLQDHHPVRQLLIATIFVGILSAGAAASATPGVLEPPDPHQVPVLVGELSGFGESAFIEILQQSARDVDLIHPATNQPMPLPRLALLKPDSKGMFALYSPKGADESLAATSATVVIHDDKRSYMYNVVLEEPLVRTAEVRTTVLAATAQKRGRASFRHSRPTLPLQHATTTAAGDLAAAPFLWADGEFEARAGDMVIVDELDGSRASDSSKRRLRRLGAAATGTSHATATPVDFSQLAASRGETDYVASSLTRVHIRNIGRKTTTLTTMGSNAGGIDWEYHFNEGSSTDDSFSAGVATSVSGVKGTFGSAGRRTLETSVSVGQEKTKAQGAFHLRTQSLYAKYGFRYVWEDDDDEFHSYELDARFITTDIERVRTTDKFPKKCTRLSGKGTYAERKNGSTTWWRNGVELSAWGADLQVLQTLAGGSSHRVKFTSDTNRVRWVCGSLTRPEDEESRVGVIMGDRINR